MLLGVAAPAVAKPVYLQCVNAKTNDDGSKVVFNVTFDEATAKLSMSNDHGVVDRPATFTAGEVRSEQSDSDPVQIDDDLRISRTTGHYTDTITVGQQTPIVSSGSCKAVPAPATKF